MRLKAYLGVAVFFVTALPSQAEITGEPQGTPPARHLVCDKGYTLKQCDEELVVLKKALAKYPIPELGEWTWVLVRSEYWRLTLLTQTLNPGIPALTDPAARATFFDDALVTGASGRMSELMTVWHMGRESLLDFAIRHELGHAFCNDANEMDADRVARLLEQKKPISCKAKIGANRQQQPPKSDACAKPTPCGEHPAFTGNCSSWGLRWRHRRWLDICLGHGNHLPRPGELS